MIVAPNFDRDVVAEGVRLGMVALPGVATPSEAFAALAAGAAALKLFPAEMIPPAAVKAVRAVLPPSTRLLPVGGIVARQPRCRTGARAPTASASARACSSRASRADEVRRRAGRWAEAWQRA